MPHFKYSARDQDGKTTSGSIIANDPRELRRILRMNDLFLTRYRGSALASDPKAVQEPTSGIFAKKPSLEDMVIATRQLGTTVRSGLPILEALEIVGDQSEKPILRAAFRDIALDVSQGQFLSTGMRKYPKLFNRLVVSLVEAGEVGGTLDQTLEVAADQLDREDNLRRRVKAALLYPKLVILACIGTITAMLLIVVPVFANVYSGLHTELPGATRLLMEISGLAVHWWWLGVLIGGAFAYGFRKYRETKGGARRVDIIALRIPVLGPLLRKIAIARFVQTLSGALRGGVPVLRSLAISASTAGNSVIREAVENAARNVRDGAAIAPELDRSGEFPLLVTRMIRAGEATGNIDTMLDEINRFYERDVAYAVDKLTRMIEPLMTVLVGGIVLLVLLALYMPIFSLSKAVLKN